MHIDIFIRDANDNSPTFDSAVYTARVYEDVPVGLWAPGLEVEK